MVSPQLRNDVQQAIAPHLAVVKVKYGKTRACITVSKTAKQSVILEITRKLRAGGYKVDGPNMLMSTDDIYVEEYPDDPQQDAADAAGIDLEPEADSDSAVLSIASI